MERNLRIGEAIPMPSSDPNALPRVRPAPLGLTGPQTHFGTTLQLWGERSGKGAMSVLDLPTQEDEQHQGQWHTGDGRR